MRRGSTVRARVSRMQLHDRTRNGKPPSSGRRRIMRSMAIMGWSAALMLIGGCNTLRGTGQDIQALGGTVEGAGERTAEFVGSRTDEQVSISEQERQLASDYDQQRDISMQRQQ